MTEDERYNLFVAGWNAAVDSANWDGMPRRLRIEAAWEKWVAQAESDAQWSDVEAGEKS
jgi:hypothetical protein